MKQDVKELQSPNEGLCCQRFKQYTGKSAPLWFAAKDRRLSHTLNVMYWVSVHGTHVEGLRGSLGDALAQLAGGIGAPFDARPRP